MPDAAADGDRAKETARAAAPSRPPPSSASDTSSEEDDDQRSHDGSSRSSLTNLHNAKGENGKQKERAAQGGSVDDGSDGSDNDGQDEDTSPAIDLDKMRKRMHHALRHLSSATKRARQFQVQRIVKRIKSCPPADKASLEAQLLALKSIDLQRVAATCILGKLGKSKLLPRGPTSNEFKTEEAQETHKGLQMYPLLAGVWSEEVIRQVWLDTSPTADPTSDSAKAKAKLLSSKSLAEESSQMMESLGRLAGREKTKAPANTVKADSKPEPSTQKRSEATRQADEDRIWSGSEDEDDDGEAEEEEEAICSDNEAESDDEDLDEETIQARIADLGDLDKWDALVGAASSAEEDGSDESEDDEREGGGEQEISSKRKRSISPSNSMSTKKPAKMKYGKPKAVSRKGDNESNSASLSDDGDESEIDSDASAPSSEGSTASSSRFLPSLAHGFLAHSRRHGNDDFSGSETDDGEIEANPEDEASRAKGVKASKERKNRMGQRARKALWEKKFGRNANHLKLQEKESRSRFRPSAYATPDGEPVTGFNEAYKPLRRGRDGRLLRKFEVPKEMDRGWKKFPLATATAPPVVELPPAYTHKTSDRIASTDSNSLSRRRENQRRTTTGTSTLTDSATSIAPSRAPRAPVLRFQTQEKHQREQDLHPSWLAKQKQKEKQDLIARSLAGGSAGGKKVTFD